MKTILLASVVAVAAVCTTGCAVTSGQSSVGQYVDDKTIATRVKARLAEDRSVSAVRIKVESLNGTVQLAGFTTTQAEKDKAAELARGVPEVRDVRNDIIVQPASN